MSSSSSLLKEALELDAGKQDFAAFKKYLLAVSSLCGDMLEICKCDEVQLRTNNVADKKMKLLKDCVERLDTIYNEIGNQKVCSDFPSTTGAIEYPKRSSISRNDPLVEAIEKNRVLSMKHRSKVESSGVSGSQLTSMNLSLQRQMTENIALAKQLKLKKDTEREKCRQATLDYLKKSKAFQNLSDETKEFISDVKAFENDCPELRLYAQYIFEKKDSQPDLLKHYLEALTDYPEHPFVTKVKDTREFFLNDLQTKNVIDEMFLISVRDMMDHILTQMSILLCDCLRLDRNYSSFIVPELNIWFFKPIMPKILQIYGSKCNNQEQTLKYIFDNPSVCSQLESSIHLTKLDKNLIHMSCEMVVSLKDSPTPEEMLDDLVSICQKFTVQHVNANADDIIAFLITIIINSKATFIVACCSLMEDFISSDQTTGEEGYCLTSLQAATNFLLSLNQDSNKT